MPKNSVNENPHEMQISEYYPQRLLYRDRDENGSIILKLILKKYNGKCDCGQ
jgi:hypothetical protein